MLVNFDLKLCKNPNALCTWRNQDSLNPFRAHKEEPPKTVKLMSWDVHSEKNDLFGALGADFPSEESDAVKKSREMEKCDLSTLLTWKDYLESTH